MPLRGIRSFVHRGEKFQAERMIFREMTRGYGGAFLREDRCCAFLKIYVLERITNAQDRMGKG